MRQERPSVLAYGAVVGQDEPKLALELNHIDPRIGGVLISGPRGTAKSTLVRAFHLMVHGDLPVTLPINATDDRVLGGWDLGALMGGRAQEQPGLLEQADERGLLYIDEVNLLDDHIVNVILDVASTGVLVVQREALDREKYVKLCLVGSMNPEEGGLRPQLLDRFGLLAATSGELDPGQRRAVIRANLANGTSGGAAQDEERRAALHAAKERCGRVEIPDGIVALCADAATAVDAVGHRGEVTTVLAARALAALESAPRVEADHVRRVLPLALRHRRPDSVHGGSVDWTEEESAALQQLFGQP